MSALPPIADIIPHCIKCLLLAISGHKIMYKKSGHFLGHSSEPAYHTFLLIGQITKISLELELPDG